MRILVTGGNGSVGRGADPLPCWTHGHQVVGLDKEAGVEGTIVHPPFLVRAEFDRGSDARWSRLLVRVEAVIHLAWSVFG